MTSLRDNLEDAFREIVEICGPIQTIAPISDDRKEGVKVIRKRANARLAEYKDAPFYADLFGETQTYLAGFR